jgi:hypothetical protein
VTHASQLIVTETTNVELVRQRAMDIAKLAEGMNPREYVASIAIALGYMLPQCYAKSQIPSVAESLRQLVIEQTRAAVGGKFKQ